MASFALHIAVQIVGARDSVSSFVYEGNGILVDSVWTDIGNIPQRFQVLHFEKRVFANFICLKRLKPKNKN